MMSKEEALIIFAKYPRVGQVKTRLGAGVGMQEAAQIYSKFAEHAFAIGAEQVEIGRRTLLFYDPGTAEDEVVRWVGRSFSFHPQIGKDLGGRMKNAFEVAFRSGVSRVVIIGTDVPELDSGRVTDAFRSLDHYDIIIGPSSDGGYYLLGMKQLVPALFSGIEWSTGSVFVQTMKAVRRLGLTCARLESLADIDTEADYEQYLQRRK